MIPDMNPESAPESAVSWAGLSSSPRGERRRGVELVCEGMVVEAAERPDKTPSSPSVIVQLAERSGQGVMEPSRELAGRGRNRNAAGGA